MNTDIVLLLVLTLAGGLFAPVLRLPPLVGFLVAGYALNALGVPHYEALDTIADIGVVLLLFGIGLKLDPRVLVRREVWLTSSVHVVATTGVTVGFLALLGLLGVGMARDEDAASLILIGVAVSFSSTVLVVKALEARSSTTSLFGRTAVGILIVQDLVAVATLGILQAEAPSPWALALVGLLPAAWVLRRMLRHLAHNELQPLYAVVLALVPGYGLFELVGLKGDLGALVVGMLLAAEPRAVELSRALFSVKELLLVGFFVSIGFVGLPTPEHLLLAGLLLLLLPLKALGFQLLLRVQGFRDRTATLTAAPLANFSEFGLIVLALGGSAGAVEEDWLVVLSTAVAVGFVFSSALDKRAEPLADIAERVLPDREPARLHPEDRPVDVGRADAVVLGMGRVGRAAYQQLAGEYGLQVVGIETDPERVEDLQAEGIDAVEGDATDPTFWHRVTEEGSVELAVLAMPFHGTNLLALRRLEESRFAGQVAMVAYFDEEAEEVRPYVDSVFGLYDGAGTSLADRAAEVAGLPRRQDRDT